MNPAAEVSIWEQVCALLQMGTFCRVHAYDVGEPVQLATMFSCVLALTEVLFPAAFVAALRITQFGVVELDEDAAQTSVWLGAVPPSS